MNRKLFALIMMLLLGMTAIVSAQTITPAPDDEINANVNITWPPPVYTLRGTIPIYGTVDLPEFSNYFIEFRPIYEENEDGEIVLSEDDAPWFPITLPSSAAVTGDVLGEWNTQTAPDDLYAIRLTVNIAGQPAQNFVVSPLRVENDVPDFLLTEPDTANGAADQPPLVQPVATITPLPQQQARPTLAISPTPVDSTPRVTANLNVNIRSGDSTEFEVVGSLGQGQTARVLGVSSTGSGWFYVRLSSGLEGWVASSVVTATGDFRGVPRIAPPPPPVTPTPTPLPVTANLTGSSPSLSPNPPVCNEPFQILVNITNTGTGPTNQPATILIQDIHVASGTVQQTFIREVPVLNPGDNFVVGVQEAVITTFFNEEHQIRVTIDPNNEVPETNTADNVLTATYILQTGDCP